MGSFTTADETETVTAHEVINSIYLYFTIDEIQKRFRCASGKAVRLLAELDGAKGIGLIENVRQGMGKPNIIYVKNFATE